MVLAGARESLRRGVRWCSEKLDGDNVGTAASSVRPERRRFLQQAGATAAVAGVGLGATSGSAAGYSAVGPELIECDMARTDDSELPWDAGGYYGGWRATEHFGVSGGSVDGPPVVFVHGNGGDACNFEEIADYMLSNGWDGDELYSVSFNDRTNNHVEMRDQLDDFVQHVLSQTGAATVSVVSHSLGVTGVRYWAEDLGRYDWIENFVGLNGANHGVCVCPGCYNASLGDDYNNWLEAGEACQFIAVQCFADPGHPLYELNLPDETPSDGSIGYHTVRGFFDPLFYCNPWSPYLDGADNNLIYHNHTTSLVDSSVKSWVDDWCSSGDETDTASEGDVSWWIDANLDGYGDTYAVVKVEEDASDKDLEVDLYDPSGNLEDYDWIYASDLDDGDQKVQLKMNGSDAVAAAGDWDLVVRYDDGSGTFYSDTVHLDDYNPLLTNDKYDIYKETDGDYYLDRWEHQVENDNADTPLHVTDYEVTIDGETDYTYPDRTLESEERDVYIDPDTNTWFSNGTGTYDVDLELYVDDQLWATGTFDVDVPQIDVVDPFEGDDGLSDYTKDAHESSPDASNTYFVDTDDVGGYDGSPYLGSYDLGAYSDATDGHDVVHTYSFNDDSGYYPVNLPEPGDTAVYYTQTDYLYGYSDSADASQVRSWFCYGVQDRDGTQKYAVEISMPNADAHGGEVRLLKFDGSGAMPGDAVELASVEADLDHQGHWYRVEVDWGTGGDHTVTVIDAEGTAGQVASFTGDDDAYGAGGIGFMKQGGPSDGLYSLAYWDHVMVEH